MPEEPRAPLVPPQEHPSLMDMLQAVVQSAGSGAGFHGITEPFLPNLPGTAEDIASLIQSMPQGMRAFAGPLQAVTPGGARTSTEILNPTPLSVVLDAFTGGLGGKTAKAAQAVSRIVLPASKTVRIAKTAEATGVTTKVAGRGQRALKEAQKVATQEGVAPVPPRRAAVTTTAQEADEIIAGNKILDKQIKQIGGKPERVKAGTRAELNLVATQLRRTKNAFSDLLSQLDPPTAQKIRAMTKEQQGNILKMGPEKGLQALGLEPNTASRLAFDVMQMDQAIQFGGTEMRKFAKKAEREALNELGIAAQRLVLELGGGVAGAVSAGATTDDPHERVGRMILGGALGVVGGSAVAAKASGAKTFDVINDVQIFNMLGSAGSIGRAYSGTVSGTLQLGLRAVLEGKGAGVGDAAKDLFKPSTMRQFMNAARGRGEAQTQFLTGRKPAEGMLGIPSNLIQAADEVGLKLGRKMGYTDDVIRDAFLTGEPATKAGAHATAALRESKIGTVISPFARVGIKSVEQTAGPFLPESFFSPGRVPTAPERAFGQMRNVAGVRAGITAEEQLPAGSERTAIAAAGPAALPFQGSLAATRFLRRSEDPLQDVSGVGEILGGTALEALPGGGARGLTNPATSAFPAQRLTPGIMAEIARALDPAFSRETRETQLERAGQDTSAVEAAFRARTPFLRETLPPVPTPRDVAGQPRVPVDRGPVSRAFFPVGRTLTAAEGLQTGEPRFPDRPSINLARRLGIEDTLGDLPVSLPTNVRGLPISITDEARRGQILETGGNALYDILDSIVTEPAFAASSEDEQRLLLERLIPKLRARVGESTSGLRKLAGAEALRDQEPRP